MGSTDVCGLMCVGVFVLVAGFSWLKRRREEQEQSSGLLRALLSVCVFCVLCLACVCIVLCLVYAGMCV